MEVRGEGAWQGGAQVLRKVVISPVQPGACQHVSLLTGYSTQDVSQPCQT